LRTNTVILDKAEAEWLSRNVLKTMSILETASQKDAQILERRTYKVIKSLSTQAKEMADVIAQLGDEPYEVELQLKVKQRQGVAAMIESTLRALETQILPEYKKRGLDKYVQDVEQKLLLLRFMQRKFK
jgi:hypothetical protein